MMLYSNGSIVARSASDRFLAPHRTGLKALPHSLLSSCTASKPQHTLRNRRCMRCS